MIEIPLSEEMRELATIKADELGQLRNSIRKGKGNKVGFLGEIAVAYFFNGDLENTYDYDVLAHDCKMEVKTKETTVVPRPDYEGSVATCNLKQRCDIYVFTRVMKDLETCWICGMIRNDEFLSKARKLTKGQKDGSNGFTVKQNCMNMYYSDMAIPDKILDYAERHDLKTLYRHK